MTEKLISRDQLLAAIKTKIDLTRDQWHRILEGLTAAAFIAESLPVIEHEEPRRLEQEPLAYVRTYYGVPAVLGGRIKINGRLGTITEDHGHYLGVVFDDDQEKIPRNCHPVWGIEYL